MRLIDADKLPKRKYPEYDETGEFIDVMCVKCEDIENAPTVDAVVLPVMAGQTVWIIANGEVLEDVVYEMGNSIVQPDKNRWLFLVEDSGEDFYDTDIGKTVFLTREAAEAALKAREN